MSFDGIKVQHGNLEQGAADVMKAAKDIEARLDQLESDLNPLKADWNGNAWRGLLLVILYCIGLGVPFLVLAFGFGWANTAVGFLRRHARTVQVLGAGAMIVIGLAMVTGLWGEFVGWLQTTFVTDTELFL